MSSGDTYEKRSLADASFIASANVSGNANGANAILNLANVREDDGLVFVGNSIQNNIGGDHVRIDAMTYFQDPQAANRARIAPVLELLKNGMVVAKSATAYTRHATGHTSSSNTIAYTDPAPAVGDIYQLRSQRGSTRTNVINIDLGHITIAVIDKIQVLIP